MDIGNLLRAGLSLAYGASRRIRNAAAALLLTGFYATPAISDEVVIAALGDSLTQGYGLVADEGLVAQLDRWLEAEGADARVINAGVSGDTTAGGLARVGWTLTPDVDAVIVALGGNDMLRGLDPGDARANLAGILDAADEAGVAVLLVGFEAPANYGPDYKTAFDAAYPELAAAYGAVFHESLLAPIQTADGLVTDFLQPDLIHPTADGVARIVEALGPKVLELIARVE